MSKYEELQQFVKDSKTARACLEVIIEHVEKHSDTWCPGVHLAGRSTGAQYHVAIGSEPFRTKLLALVAEQLEYVRSNVDAAQAKLDAIEELLKED